MFKLVKKKQKKPVSLKDHYERRNKILIKRVAGGFGDILMSRMMFEDLSKSFPNCQLTFACPNPYIELATGHPFVNTIELNKVQEEDYGMVYTITTCCRVHEIRHGKNNTKNRSDIWAEYCGVQLANHNMYLDANIDMIDICNKYLEHVNKEKKPIILLSTKSTDNDFGISKSLLPEQIRDIVTNLKQDYFIFTIHNEKQAIYDQLGIEQITNIHPQAWLALVKLADYVISIDSATFHMAGGLKKPLVGIFTFTDGKIYGKYYDFVLVQKHRDNGNWDCGPCFNLNSCPKTSTYPKPCLYDLSSTDILQGFYEATKKWPFSESDQKI